MVDFTWVLAGPFCTRILGDLGADVIKFQTEDRARPSTSDDYPYYYVWNRSKRSAMLEHEAPGAPRRHPQKWSSRPTCWWRTTPPACSTVGASTTSRCTRGTPASSTSRCRAAAKTAPGRTRHLRADVHALCGLTALTNPADRRDVGPGFSLNDHASRAGRPPSTSSGLEARRRTGGANTSTWPSSRSAASSSGPPCSTSSPTAG